MVRTQPGERERIRKVIAGVHNAVFADHLEPEDVELTQLLSDENEMDAYGNRFGVNIEMWRQWSAEKKLEVLLHEMTHVAEPDDNHRPSFWRRFVEVVEAAEAHQDDIEAVFETDVDFSRVKEIIIDEVHEGVVDLRMDTVPDRRQWCREQFGLRPRGKMRY